MGGWLLDSRPLEALLELLRDTYAKCSWTNPEQRADMAKGVLYLDGLARLEMTRSVALRAYDEDADDAPPILSLLKNPEVMQRLRAVVASALGRHLVIDMATQAPQVIWRLADEKPGDGLESSYSGGANAYHSRAALLEDRSDGIHAFIGMLAAIFAKATDRIFIDEPEAFLHPPWCESSRGSWCPSPRVRLAILHRYPQRRSPGELCSGQRRCEHHPANSQ